LNLCESVNLKVEVTNDIHDINISNNALSYCFTQTPTGQPNIHSKERCDLMLPHVERLNMLSSPALFYPFDEKKSEVNDSDLKSITLICDDIVIAYAERKKPSQHLEITLLSEELACHGSNSYYDFTRFTSRDINESSILDTQETCMPDSCGVVFMRAAYPSKLPDEFYVNVPGLISLISPSTTSFPAVASLIS